MQSIPTLPPAPTMKTWLNIFGAGILFASAIGLVSLVIVAVNLRAVSDSANEISDEVVEGVSRGADSLDSASSALAQAADSVETFDTGLGSTDDALDDATEALATSKDVSGEIEESFAELGASLTQAADLLSREPTLITVGSSVRSAGEAADRISRQFSQYSPIFDQADADVKSIQLSLAQSRDALPGIRSELESASVNMAATGDSLDSASASIQQLRDSPAIPRAAIFALVFLGTVNLLLAFVGLVALAAARKLH